jgi:flagellar biosynthetic protein FliO
MEWLRLVFSLTGIIGLIFFMYWMMRKVNKQLRVSSGSKLRILDRANTGRDSSLLVVSVSGRLMLVGVSAQRIEKLCDLDIGEDEYLGSALYADNADKPAIKFGDILSNFIKFGAKNREQTEINSAEGEEDTVESENKTSNESE